MLQLPLEPQYAKMVLYGVALKCLDPILTIAAFSKHKSVAHHIMSNLTRLSCHHVLQFQVHFHIGTKIQNEVSHSRQRVEKNRLEVLQRSSDLD